MPDLPDWSAAVVGRRALTVGLGAALLQLGAGRTRATADPAFDIQLLQTAASVENVLVSTYETLLAVPLLSGPNANPVLKALLTTARAQHGDHATACNELATKLGGGAQNGPNPGLAQVVNRARPGSSDLGATVELALQLELASAQTYHNHVGLLGDLNARRLAASILGVESQHVGLLRVAQALVAARTPDLLSLEGEVRERLPPEAATAGFPESFSKSDQARPPTEGAVR
ncbi:MAG: ferritin-like domain-containing protein [Actinomycetota bacterium]|nr:ferritin-like domain-containing protein [Actinomycetota bacterium]